ncbi:MAG: hypothetical protein ACRDT0_26635 [Pseudonocardiaceae bacterium]
MSDNSTSSGGERVWSPVIDQHATWIAVNPIQGCPKACVYCFLHERGQAAVRPEVLASPAETVELLVSSTYYGTERAVALYTWTDVMALPRSRAHLAQVLEELAQRRVPNPIVLITKCHVPDSTIEAMCRARAGGVRLITYLSHSGLGADVERGIRRPAIVQNFPRITTAGLPVIHYWRPALPGSATSERMATVLDWASRFARCTVAAGLKVEDAALPRLAEQWPALAEVAGVTSAEGVYPAAFWDFLADVPRSYPGYPLFHSNACALAYALQEVDRFGIFGSEVCRRRNVCPAAQRDRCELGVGERSVPTRRAVEKALAHRGVAGSSFEIGDDGRDVVLDDEVPTSTVAALTQDLGVRVRGHRDQRDPYWNSGTAGAQPLVLE